MQTGESGNNDPSKGVWVTNRIFKYVLHSTTERCLPHWKSWTEDQDTELLLLNLQTCCPSLAFFSSWWLELPPSWQPGRTALLLSPPLRSHPSSRTHCLQALVTAAQARLWLGHAEVSSRWSRMIIILISQTSATETRALNQLLLEGTETTYSMYVVPQLRMHSSPSSSPDLHCYQHFGMC